MAIGHEAVPVLPRYSRVDPWVISSNTRLPVGGQAVGGASRCGDLSACGWAAQVISNGAAYADRLLLGKGGSEDVAPLTGASPESHRLWSAGRTAGDQSSP
jgi:hypothetical protein